MAELANEYIGVQQPAADEAPPLAQGNAAAGAEFGHPSDTLDELVVHGAEPHPHAPGDDDQSEWVPSQNPVTAQAPAELTPEEQAAAIQEVLRADEVENLDLRTLVFDFGPFRRLELQMRELCAEMVSPEISDAVISHVRNSIHHVVVASPHLTSEAKTQEGLLARINALTQVGDLLSHPTHPKGVLLDKLKALDVPNIERLQTGLDNLMKMERDRLGLATKQLQPATLGTLLTHGLRRMFRDDPVHLVGDARRHRNSELVKAVDCLKKVATELKDNAGKAEWERTQGLQSANEVGNLRERIHKLTKGVEDQIDSRDLRKGLDDVSDLLNSARDSSADEAHKGRLTELTKSMAEFIKTLTAALGRLFAKPSGGNSPRPA